MGLTLVGEHGIRMESGTRTLPLSSSRDITFLGLSFLICIMETPPFLWTLNRMPYVKYLIYRVHIQKCYFAPFSKSWLNCRWAIAAWLTSVCSQTDCTRHSIMPLSGVILPWTTLDVLKLHEKITKEVTVCTHMRKVIGCLWEDRWLILEGWQRFTYLSFHSWPKDWTSVWVFLLIDDI